MQKIFLFEYQILASLCWRKQIYWELKSIMTFSADVEPRNYYLFNNYEFDHRTVIKTRQKVIFGSMGLKSCWEAKEWLTNTPQPQEYLS